MNRQETHTAQASAPEICRRLLGRNNLAVLTVDTTGKEIEDQAIEIAAIGRDGNPLFHSRLNPGHPVSAGATAVHGITQDMIDQAPATAQLEPAMREALTGKTLAAYNLPFALSKLQYTLVSAGLPAIELHGNPPACIIRLHTEWRQECDGTTYRPPWATLNNALLQSGLRGLPANTGTRARATATLALLRFMARQ